MASDSSGTSVFATTLAGTSVTSVLIPSGKSSATFYYGDSAPEVQIADEAVHHLGAR